MYSKKVQLHCYKKFLLSRAAAVATLTEYIETCLTSDNEGNKYSFHKIMVHNWSSPAEQLFSVMTDYFSVTFIPMEYSIQNNLATFYTSSLTLILKIIKLDFMFPFERNMYNVNVLFNDKSSADCFDNWLSIEDIVGSVVSNRLNEKLELDLSNFCNDQEFIDKKIHFFRFNLLSYFKILMIRMGRDTKYLNLSGNNLSQLPMDVLNFFTKGNLISINLSNNNIASIAELQRYSSKIEKIWLEGNPCCEELDAPTYVKQITMKFPRVTEIDGVKLNENGLVLPFLKNFAISPDKHTKMLIEKFLSLYFSHFDHSRHRIDHFYFPSAILTLTTPLTGPQVAPPPHLRARSHPGRQFHSKPRVLEALNAMPHTTHDPATFCVDIMLKNKNHMMVIIDGVFKLTAEPKRVFKFRRTFLFKTVIKNPSTTFYITNEVFQADLATPEQIQNSFLQPSRNLYDYALINPDPDEKDMVTNALCYLTQLRKDEAVSRLKTYDWDIKKALQFFSKELKDDLISMDKFAIDLDEAQLSADENMDEDEID